MLGHAGTVQHRLPVTRITARRSIRLSAIGNPNGKAAVASSPMTKQAVVVGAGPAGCLAAMLLVQQGWKVNIFEKRPAAVGQKSKQRSWILALYPRGIQAIEKALPQGLKVLETRKYKGLMMGDFSSGGKRTMLRRPGALIDRTLLANALLDEVLAMLPTDKSDGSITTGSLDIQFNRTLASLDMPSSTATFEVQDHTMQDDASTIHGTTTVRYDLLIGADGANSAVRRMMEEEGLITSKIISTPQGQYKSWSGLPAVQAATDWDPDRAAGNMDDKQGLYFNVIFNLRKGKLAVTTSLDDDGTFCGYVSCNKEDWAKLQTLDDYAAALTSSCPALPKAWVSELSQQLLTTPPSNLPVIRTVSEFTPNTPGGGIVLIGDARGTFTPALGQGVNAALEDAATLADLVAKAGPGRDGLQAALQEYDSIRRPEIGAVQELEMMMSALIESPMAAKRAAGWSQKFARVKRWWHMAAYIGLTQIPRLVASSLLKKLFKAQTGGFPSYQNIMVIDNPPMAEMLYGMSYVKMLNKIKRYGAVCFVLTSLICMSAAYGTLNGGAVLLTALLASAG